MNIQVLRQYLVPQHGLSRFAGLLAGCQYTWWKNWLIKDFIKRYRVDMSIAQLEQPEDYTDFNHFFTRALKPDARPIAPAKEAIVSPADGCVSQIGQIRQNALLQAKGFDFSLQALLGAPRLAELFENGSFATIYLSPRDYHRVHMPWAGNPKETIYIPGKLFSVNPLTTQTVPGLFARNERLVCLFETEIGPMAVILVGAMIVGSIGTIWCPEYRSGTVIANPSVSSTPLDKGAELGRFKLGSTVIILFGKEAIEWAPSLTEGSAVQMGQAIGQINKGSC